MIKVALINSNGEITTILYPATDSLYENNKYYGDLLSIHISSAEDSTEYIKTKYYDFELESFKDRIPKPSEYHDWMNKDWEFNRDKAVEKTRLERNRKLTASDWTQVSDSPLTAEQKAAWQTYRQALRDLPSTIPQDIMSIAEILWPSPPS